MANNTKSKKELFEDRLEIVKKKLISKVHLANQTNDIPFLVLNKDNLHYCDQWHRNLLHDRKSKLKNGSEIISSKSWGDQLAIENDDFLIRGAISLTRIDRAISILEGRVFNTAPVENPNEFEDNISIQETYLDKRMLHDTLWQAISYYNNNTITLAQAAIKFNVTYNQIKNFFYKLKSSKIGLVPLIDKRRCKSKLIKDDQKQFIIEHAREKLPRPIFLKEIQRLLKARFDNFSCSYRTLQRAISEQGFKYGKLEQEKRIDSIKDKYEYNYVYFSHFINGILDSLVINIDESGFNRESYENVGWYNTNLDIKPQFSTRKYKNLTQCLGACTSGLIWYRFIEGACTKIIFIDFLADMLDFYRDPNNLEFVNKNLAFVI